MSVDKPTRICLTSDQAIYLRGMASLVMSMPEYQMIGQATTGVEALQLCELAEPDVVLLDLKIDPEGSLAVARQIHERWPLMCVVLLVRTQEDTIPDGTTSEMPAYFLSRDVYEDEFKSALLHVREDIARGEHPTAERTNFVHIPTIEGDIELPPPPLAPAPRNQEMLAREMVMAGRIQADILPEEPPVIPGWDICARLEPARETSGDFYDFLPLTEHKWGIVMADVTDKGMGAALFMALSSSLLRTYAARFPNLPAWTLNSVSERILSDTRGSMFVTAFFGILEPHTGRLIYANAGHPPGFIISNRRNRQVIDWLRPTGMALGVSEDAQWRSKAARLELGDYLVLYTDGITEPQDPQGTFFGEERLLDTVLSLAHEGVSARRVLTGLLDEVHRFVGGAPRQDDIAVVVIRREK